ncbi:sugar ABC transporter permease [Paenibacillus sp. IB182496]|uniref:Sugar ABC transporter permease n=1 Tax=Paenibacillus sabuli TaxID=2772509 RepID=A0A927BR05_9BACL|nr:ABC transporter permease subunit [Paenibacillus sabuli]MBD2844160.1 sugar ABC transporter permease [Paenibacillus sabuli]
MSETARLPISRKIKKGFLSNWEFYVMLLPAIAVTFVFSYLPLYGLQIAFKTTRLGANYLNGDWIGFDHFVRFFNAGWFGTIMKNTVLLSVGSYLIAFPFTIMLALMIFNAVNKRLAKFTQTFTYLPHLLSGVVVIGILNLFVNGETGLINIFLRLTGQETISFFGRNDMVLPLYIITNLWQHVGFSAIVYLAALNSIDGSIVESARIDGANKFKIMMKIQLPWILPVIVTMLILNMGHILNVSVDKVLLMQTDLNISASEVIATYVYKAGIQGAQYGFAAAVGLFNNCINLAMLLFINWLSRRINETSIF